MKTFFLAVIMSVFTSGVFSAPTIPPYVQMIKSEIGYPEFAKQTNEEGIVLVSFTVDNSGKVHVMETNSDNPELCNYVVQRLSELNLPDTVEDTNEYNLKFVFRLI